MADIDAALMAYLKGDATLHAIVADRIHFVSVPKDTAYPYITIIDVSNEPERTHQGMLRIERPRKQFTAWATTKKVARQVANRLRALLDNYSGTLSGVVVQDIMILNDISTASWTEDGVVDVDTVNLEYIITYERT